MDEHLAMPVLRAGHLALRKGRVSIPNTAYLVTTVTRGRVPLFRDFRFACAAARCFESPQVLEDATLLAWVLMPDHVHWLVQLGDSVPLSRVIMRLKAASARRVNRLAGQCTSLWSPAFHDRALRAEDDLQAVARYIVANPVRAGLVRSVRDYSFWNAVWV